MSILADEQARRGFPVHQQVNGDPVTRIPATGDPVTGIVGVWTEYAEDRLSAMRPKRDMSEGLEIERHGLLLVASSLTVLDTDRWTVLGETWELQRVGQVGGGYRELYLQRNDKKRTSMPARQRTI